MTQCGTKNRQFSFPCFRQSSARTTQADATGLPANHWPASMRVASSASAAAERGRLFAAPFPSAPAPALAACSCSFTPSGSSAVLLRARRWQLRAVPAAGSPPTAAGVAAAPFSGWSSPGPTNKGLRRPRGLTCARCASLLAIRGFPACLAASAAAVGCATPGCAWPVAARASNSMQPESDSANSDLRRLRRRCSTPCSDGTAAPAAGPAPVAPAAAATASLPCAAAAAAGWPWASPGPSASRNVRCSFLRRLTTGWPPSRATSSQPSWHPPLAAAALACRRSAARSLAWSLVTSAWHATHSVRRLSTSQRPPPCLEPREPRGRPGLMDAMPGRRIPSQRAHMACAIRCLPPRKPGCVCMLTGGASAARLQVSGTPRAPAPPCTQAGCGRPARRCPQRHAAPAGPGGPCTRAPAGGEGREGGGRRCGRQQWAAGQGSGRHHAPRCGTVGQASGSRTAPLAPQLSALCCLPALLSGVARGPPRGVTPAPRRCAAAAPPSRGFPSPRPARGRTRRQPVVPATAVASPWPDRHASARGQACARGSCPGPALPRPAVSTHAAPRPGTCRRLTRAWQSSLHFTHTPRSSLNRARR